MFILLEKMRERIEHTLKENKAALIFIAKLAAVFLVLYLFYEEVLSVYTSANDNLIGLIMQHSERLLVLLGYDLLQSSGFYQYHIGIANTSGVVIGDPCNGMSLFILFASFILVFKGKWWFKLICIFIGIFSIYLLNVFRIVALCIVVKYNPESLQFHHAYTFTLLVYAFIFLLWVVRIRVYMSYKL